MSQLEDHTSDKMAPPTTESLRLQRLATDPGKSIWVSANAGSGKTFLLARRVIRLLLAGNKPAQLLCLTFTKVAAAEMTSRVFSILSEWTMLEDGALQQAVFELTGSKPSEERLIKARQLFALALDTPGGLRIQTIHAFCESLLHQFPLEANIPAHFEIMDQHDEALLLAEAQRRVMLFSLGHRFSNNDDIDIKVSEQERQYARELADAYDTVRSHASDKVIEESLRELIAQRDRFQKWMEQSGSVGDIGRAMTRLYERFSIEAGASHDQLMALFATDSLFQPSHWTRIREMAVAKDSVSFDTLVKQIDELALATDPAIIFSRRCEIFLVKDRSKPRASLVSKVFLEHEPELKVLFEKEQSLLLNQLNSLRSLEVLAASNALFKIADAILAQYSVQKNSRGLLDFNDLISRTSNLLNRSEISAWIQYKLDMGISHVLVDEAQDTSPQQWEIINAITAEFYAGEGIKSEVRTEFVVGDEKQSIFSFQGADPQEFDHQQRRLLSHSNRALQEPEIVKLSVSFRSTDEVLSAVDQVFSIPQNSRGLAAVGILPSHSANRFADRGEVIIWPPEIKPEKPDLRDWRLAPDRVSEESAEVKLAKKIASTIAEWMDSGEKLPGQERKLRYGDILILVRKRDRFAAAIIRELKRKHLITAGADRLKLTQHIAVEDMMAIARFATMTRDDLALAGILKSPLFDFDEDELFELLQHRNGSSLFEHMLFYAEANSQSGLKTGLQQKIVTSVRLLNELISSASCEPVFEFYGKLFAKTNLRQKYLLRLGSEVAEILDAFLQTCLDYDQKSGLGLIGFVEWLALASPELKRQIDTESNEVRVITAHSSKGLEAPVVFLVDPGIAAFSSAHVPKIIGLPREASNSEAEDLLWQSKKEFQLNQSTQVIKQLEADAEAEYRRLLYVGMTRAADRLIICGYQKPDTKFDHWHKMILNGLNSANIDGKTKAQLREVHNDDGSIKEWRWELNRGDHEDKALKTNDQKAEAKSFERPAWLRPAIREQAPPRPLTPSGVFDLLEIETVQEPNYTNSDNQQAMLRGSAIHQLLQILPDIQTENRGPFLERYFSALAVEANSEFCRDIEVSVSRILDNPLLTKLFGAGSRAEVAISGSIMLGGREHMVRGQIDRMIVEKDRVLFADYKTNRMVPNHPTAIPQQYLAQMALYREMLRQMFLDKEITAQLVWTQNASIMAIPTDLMDHQMHILNQV